LLPQVFYGSLVRRLAFRTAIAPIASALPLWHKSFLHVEMRTTRSDDSACQNDNGKSQAALAMKRHPQVLHIGFSKCASTYLRALFRAHPKIHLVFKSGFFTPFLAKEMTFADYQAFFCNEVAKINIESDEHLTLPGIHPELGVRTTNLAEFARVADRIRRFLPEVKIIVIIRNQASLIVSRYSEFLITGGSLSFEAFASKLMGEDGRENIFYQNYYSEIIKILEERFPRSNLLILLQEAMREDTRRTAITISQFIGLGDILTLTRGLRAERRSLSLAGMQLLRWLNKYLIRRPSMGGAPPISRVPMFVFRNVVRLVRGIDYFGLGRVSRGAASVLEAEHRKGILAHFHDDNLRLQDYFARELRSLGYFSAESMSHHT